MDSNTICLNKFTELMCNIFEIDKLITISYPLYNIVKKELHDFIHLIGDSFPQNDIYYIGAYIFLQKKYIKAPKLFNMSSIKKNIIIALSLALKFYSEVLTLCDICKNYDCKCPFILLEKTKISYNTLINLEITFMKKIGYVLNINNETYNDVLKLLK